MHIWGKKSCTTITYWDIKKILNRIIQNGTTAVIDLCKILPRCRWTFTLHKRPLINGNCNSNTYMPSVLWHRWWLGVRKSMWPVKIEWRGVVICVERGADCLHMVQLIPLNPKTLSSLASFKSRLVLPFRYRLTQVVLENRLLNGCSINSSS